MNIDNIPFFNYNIKLLCPTLWVHHTFWGALNFKAYDFFVSHDGKPHPFTDDDFYMQLKKFSKYNQVFYGVHLKEKNYILDCRCNKICLDKERFTFYDYNNVKCIMTIKVHKNMRY